MIALWLLALLAAPRHGAYTVVETRTIRESIPLEGLRGLTVDNFFGSIKVTGDEGGDIRMVVAERIEAVDQARLAQARAEASLKTTRHDDRILICADGPFREPDDCTKWKRGLHQEAEYRVVYEIELRVPRSIDLTIGTIQGDLAVTEVRGRLDVGGVAGSVSITGAAGPVRAGTVGGAVRVRFAQNPQEDSRFSTINGKIEVTFQSDLSADLSFETMNGEVVTDFEYQILPPAVRRSASPDAGTTYRLDVDSAIRIGAGGPRHLFKSIDGDITIRRN